MANEKRKGLIIVHTGPGKGKTTAGLGLAMGAEGRRSSYPVEARGACHGENEARLNG